MRIEATVGEIRVLLRLAELDARAKQLSPEMYRSCREETRRCVPKALLERYERLFGIGRNPVIVGMDRGSCSGCHVRLATMVEHQARRKPGIYSCPHCRRILYTGDLSEDTGRPIGPPNAIDAKPSDHMARKAVVSVS